MAEINTTDAGLEEPGQPAQGGPRIVVNPKVFSDKRDALCVAMNEAFRVLMEMNGFDPVSEPTKKQRKFFADTAYADDELMLRRTILARICTFDTSVTDPTTEQLQESVEFLETVMEIGAPQNEWEQQAVQRIHDILVKAAESGTAPTENAEEPEAPVDTEGTTQGDVGGGITDDEEKKQPDGISETTQTIISSFQNWENQRINDTIDELFKDTNADEPFKGSDKPNESPYNADGSHKSEEGNPIAEEAATQMTQQVQNGGDGSKESFDKIVADLTGTNTEPGETASQQPSSAASPTSTAPVDTSSAAEAPTANASTTEAFDAGKAFGSAIEGIKGIGTKSGMTVTLAGTHMERGEDGKLREVANTRELTKDEARALMNRAAKGSTISSSQASTITSYLSGLKGDDDKPVFNEGQIKSMRNMWNIPKENQLGSIQAHKQGLIQNESPASSPAEATAQVPQYSYDLLRRKRRRQLPW